MKFLNYEFLTHKESFLKLHLGCGSKYFYGYLNIDIKKTQATDLVCNIFHLPFSKNSVEVIEVYYKIEHFKKTQLIKLFRKWWNLIIPGGKLIIVFVNKEKTSIKKYEKDVWSFNFLTLKDILKKCGYNGIVQYQTFDDRIKPGSSVSIESYKSLKKEIYSDISIRKGTNELQMLKKILINHKDYVLEGKNAIIIGRNSKEFDKKFLKREFSIDGLNLSILKLNKKKNQYSQLKLQAIDNSYDSVFLIKFLEYIDPKNVNQVFSEIKRILKPNAKLFITVPDRDSYIDPLHRQLFTKGTLARLLDDNNLFISSMDLREFKYKSIKLRNINTCIINKPSFQIKQKRKICAIGRYQLFGYSQLGFHWDGQKRAFKELGFDTLLINIRKHNNYKNLRSLILEFEPDILWLGLKDCLPFVERIKEDLKKLESKVIYWYYDYTGIEGMKNELPLVKPIINPIKMKSILDYIFITNAGQIMDYRKAYGVENVYYIPQGCTPAFHHRKHLKEKYDLVFTGDISSMKFHKKRTELILKLSRHYNTKIVNNVRNNISEFYSSSKIVFGTNWTFGTNFQPYLYSSNRLFIALGCGAFYICEWFPGIEKLVQNHKHCVWFKTENELFQQIDYYLENKEERDKIRKNAQKLAHTKHTYVKRIQNILDIIDGKTNKFYAFLKNE